jgi:hypothetical protein
LLLQLCNPLRIESVLKPAIVKNFPLLYLGQTRITCFKKTGLVKRKNENSIALNQDVAVAECPDVKSKLGRVFCKALAFHVSPNRK